MTPPLPPADRLSWCIPPGEDDWPLARWIGEGRPRLWFWLSLAAPVLVFLAIVPRTRPLGIAGLLLYVLTVLTLAARRLVAVGQESDVELSSEGVRWRTPWGERISIPREKIQGFRVEHCSSSQPRNAALVLLLEHGFETWPLDLHEPATPQAVRSFLLEHMLISEQPPRKDEFFDERYERFLQQLDQDPHLDASQREQRLRQQAAVEARRLGFFAVADVVERIWRFEGARSSLLELCRRWSEAAERIRLAPDYARPEQQELGGWAMRVALEAAEEIWLTDGAICGPPSWHRDLAAEVQRRLQAAPEMGEVVIDVPASSWRLRFVTQKDFDPATLV